MKGCSRRSSDTRRGVLVALGRLGLNERLLQKEQRQPLRKGAFELAISGSCASTTEYTGKMDVHMGFTIEFSTWSCDESQRATRRISVKPARSRLQDQHIVVRDVTLQTQEIEPGFIEFGHPTKVAE